MTPIPTLPDTCPHHATAWVRRVVEETLADEITLEQREFPCGCMTLAQYDAIADTWATKHTCILMPTP